MTTNGIVRCRAGDGEDRMSEVSCIVCGGPAVPEQSECTECAALDNRARYERWKSRAAKAPAAAASGASTKERPGYTRSTQEYPPAHSARGHTNSKAIVAFVLALAVCGPAGLFLGYSARSEIERTGEDGEAFAVAAIVLGWIWVALIGLFVLLGLAL